MEPAAAPLNLSDQEQGLSSSIAFQAYALFLTMSGVFTQVKLQNDNVSPTFQKYNAIISTFVVALFIYVGTVILGKRLQIGIAIIGAIRLLSGTVAPILLLLILVPIVGWLLLVLWVFLAAKMAWDYLWQQYHHLLCQACSHVFESFRRLMAHSSTPVEGPQQLPV